MFLVRYKNYHTRGFVRGYGTRYNRAPAGEKQEKILLPLSKKATQKQVAFGFYKLLLHDFFKIKLPHERTRAAAFSFAS